MVVNPGTKFNNFRLKVRRPTRDTPGVLCEKSNFEFCRIILVLIPKLARLTLRVHSESLNSNQP